MPRSSRTIPCMEMNSAPESTTTPALPSGNADVPRVLVGIHGETLSGWHHLAIRSLIEMDPDPGDWAALGRRLRPRRSAATVRRSVKLLEAGGLLEKRADGLWHAMEKAVATSPETPPSAIRRFHRRCLGLAAAALENTHPERRDVTGLTLGVSEKSYRLIRDRLSEMRAELARIADADAEADRVYQIVFAMFPLSDSASMEAPQ